MDWFAVERQNMLFTVQLNKSTLSDSTPWLLFQSLIGLVVSTTYSVGSIFSDGSSSLASAIFLTLTQHIQSSLAVTLLSNVGRATHPRHAKIHRGDPFI